MRFSKIMVRVNCFMTGVIWAEFIPMIPGDWTLVFPPLVVTTGVTACVLAYKRLYPRKEI